MRKLVEFNCLVDSFILSRARGGQTHLVGIRAICDCLLIVYWASLYQQPLSPKTIVKESSVAFYPPVKGSEFDVCAHEITFLVLEKCLINELVFLQSRPSVLER